MTAPDPSTGDSRYVLHADGRVLILKWYVSGEQAYIYDPTSLRDGYVAADDLSDPLPGQDIALTEPQRNVAYFRFVEADYGAQLYGSTLHITSVVEALATLDAAIDVLADNVASGYDRARNARELAVTKRLRAKILDAARAGV